MERVPKILLPEEQNNLEEESLELKQQTCWRIEKLISSAPSVCTWIHHKLIKSGMKQSWHYRYFVPNVEISGDCPSISICGICEQKHVTNSCPSLPGLKAVYQGANEETEQICFIGQRRPWKPRPPGMVQDPSSFYSAFWTNQKN